jgi:hypothetical protein
MATACILAVAISYTYLLDEDKIFIIVAIVSFNGINFLIDNDY